jgi:hypothetical protein
MNRGGAVGVPAAAVLAAACGGNEGPSRAEYTARANTICAPAETRTGPLVRAGRYVAQLRRLERPSDDEEETEAFLGPAERLVSELGRAAGALGRRDVLGAAGVVQESQRMAGDAQAAAGRYGLSECRAFAALVPS